MKRLLTFFLLIVSIGGLQAQVIDTVVEVGIDEWGPLTIQTERVDTVYLYRTDTLVRTVWFTDTVYVLHTDTVTVRVADTAALKALQEKEVFYREILTTNGVDKEKLEAERNYYIRMVDSLRAIVRVAEIDAVRKEEANKYLMERAKTAEEKVAAATNRKKKVRPIQGVAMRFYRTPAWEIRLDANGDRHIANRNAGSIEFDYVTGASVMLWDMTPYFNRGHSLKSGEIPKFDQDFAYDLGLYVGFGGSNLFKNFYVGPTFKFLDFFHLTTGVNVCEYEMLTNGLQEGDILEPGFSLTDQISKVWKPKPFVSLSFDLDFISYIKK